MSVSYRWMPEGKYGRVECYVYPAIPPILEAENNGVSLTITGGERESVSAEHAEFARRFADATTRYARECARWVASGDQSGGQEASEE